jgi:hypothetical protein
VVIDRSWVLGLGWALVVWWLNASLMEEMCTSFWVAVLLESYRIDVVTWCLGLFLARFGRAVSNAAVVTVLPWVRDIV